MEISLDKQLDMILIRNPKLTQKVIKDYSEEMKMSLDMSQWINKFNVVRRVAAHLRG